MSKINFIGRTEASIIFLLSYACITLTANQTVAKDNVGELTCESIDYKPRICKPKNRFIYEIGSVQRISEAPCIRGQSYIINSSGAIAVSNGCRAKFVYRWSRERRPIEDNVTRQRPRQTTSAQSGSYFVSRRFYCKSKSSQNEARDVTVNANSNNSCNEACDGYRQEMQRLNSNPCVYGGNMIDRDLYSYRNEWIHAGQCQGQTC